MPQLLRGGALPLSPREGERGEALAPALDLLAGRHRAGAASSPIEGGCLCSRTASVTSLPTSVDYRLTELTPGPPSISEELGGRRG